MQRYSCLLRLFLLFVLLCLGLCVFVSADEPQGKGFLSFVQDYFDEDTEIENIPEPSVSVLDDSIDTSEPPALMSVSPDDVNDGLLNFSYESVFDYSGKANVAFSISSSSAINRVRTVLVGDEVESDVPINFTDTIVISCDSPIVDKGQIFDFSLNGITNYWDYTKENNAGESSTFDYECLDPSYIDVSIYLVYFNGIRELATTKDLIFKMDSSGKYFEVFASIEDAISYDLSEIEIVMKYNMYEAYNMPHRPFEPDGSVSYYPHHTAGFYNSEFTLSIHEATNGLLGGIIDWLKGIWEGITSLPGKIVSGIGELLQSLFVPSSDSLNEWKNKFDVFFSDHFGFVYQGASIIVDVFEVVIGSLGNVQDTITFPLFEYDFGDGAVFSFGGYEVDVVPEGFEGLVETLKFVINIVMTLAFLNVSLKYFDKFLNR